MPVVVDLRCKSLQDRHWEKIQDIIGFDIFLDDPDFTLKTLLELKVNDHKEEIAEIALKAKKEEELEKQLKEVVSSWDGIEFQFKYDKEKEFFMFTDVEDI